MTTQGTITERQYNYIIKLTSERIAPLGKAGQAEIRKLSKKEASERIDGLLKIRPPVRSAPGPTRKVDAPAWPGEVTPHADQPDAKPGYYITDSKDLYCVVENKAKTHTYAKKLIIQANRGKWVYAPGAAKVLANSSPLTVEEAARLGHLHGFCVICGAPLTTPKSVSAGIGPTCLQNLARSRATNGSKS